MAAAIQFDAVSKDFRVWHERNDSLKARFLRRGRGRYTEYPALKGVSFEVPEGSTFGIVGANGSGKSTSLKLMARILVPSSGTVTVNGKVSALLELGAGFHHDLTGRENIYLNGSILGLSRAKLRARFDDIVDFAGLEEFIDNQVKTYSSGMFARLGFAVAVNVEPDILLVDEVLAVGDAAFQRKCTEKIAEMRSGGRTVVVVSHDLGLVRHLCERSAWVDHGDLKALGPTTQVLEEYQRSVHPDAIVDSEGRVRFGTGAARVSHVGLIPGAGGRPQARDKLTIRLAIDPLVQPHDYNVGVDIRRPDGIFVTGITVRPRSRLTGPRLEPTVLTYTMSELPLLPGNYVLHTWMRDDTTDQVLDATDQLRFEVDPEPGMHDHGIVALGGSWDIDP